jgi:aspartyl-tRNA(Asn)/glutamyl-tRNA(Gln) amidotransferase subunit C
LNAGGIVSHPGGRRTHLKPDEIQRLARLARLDLEPEEASRLAADLTTILDYVAMLDDLDLAGVPPHGEAVGPGAPSSLRDDVPHPSLPTTRAMAAAPEEGEGLFRVPPVLE